MTNEQDSPWLCRDQRRGALGSCVHPHRPWSKSHTLSDEGEVATVAAVSSKEEPKGGTKKKEKRRRHMKSKAISDKEAFAAEAATSSNGIQRLSSLVLQLPNNAINPAFLLLSSVMACTDSPVVVMGTVVLSAAAAVGVVENAAVVVSANKHTAHRSEVFLQKLLSDI